MLTLNDGRSELWQWDTGRKLTVDADCTQVHFSNKFFGRSVDVDVFDGTAEIPDALLQVDKDLLVWAFVGTAENGYTKISKVFKVNKRNKPADYVFTPPEQTTLGELIERLDKIEESQDPDAIKNAVDDYLANNPIEIDETDPTVPEWAKQPKKPTYTAKEVGALAKEDLQGGIDEALAQAKASGEFDGKDGFSPIAKVTQTDDGAVITITDKDGTTEVTISNGKDGKDGYTPQKGVDYFDGQPGKDGADGQPGANGQDGSPGADGKDGITPHVGSNGNWFIGENDTGISATGPAGGQGLPGTPGEDGKDGVSATHSWNGTVLTITSASGTSSADLKGAKGDQGEKGADGAKGDKGDQGIQGIQGIQGEKGDKGDTGATGANGKDGTSVTVKSVNESSADGGSNVVSFSDGKTLTVKNGSKGADGKTPVKGTDYFTAADKTELVNAVIVALPDASEVSY